MSDAARAFLGRPFTSARSAIDMDTLESLLDAFAAEQTATLREEVAQAKAEIARLRKFSMVAAIREQKERAEQAEARVGRLLMALKQQHAYATAAYRPKHVPQVCGVCALLADPLGQRLAEECPQCHSRG